MNFIQYIKQAWKAGTSGGTPLSPDRLNHMEDGIKNNNNMISELNSNNITNNICTNLLNPTLKTSSQNGITCTNNGDGTYTLNGTASDNAVFILQSNIEIASGKYKLTGCPQGGSTTSFKLDFEYKGNSTGIDYGNGNIINKTSNDIFKYLRIVIYTGTILNNAVFKPMLTTNLSATYDDFVPYTGDTGRLNADVALLNNNIMTYKDISNFINAYQGRVNITYKKATYRQDGLVQLHVRCELLMDLPNTLQSLLSINNADYYVVGTACTICVGTIPSLGFLNYSTSSRTCTIDMTDNKAHTKGETIIINAAYFVKN
jgi:hypothetical protein